MIMMALVDEDMFGPSASQYFRRWSLDIIGCGLFKQTAPISSTVQAQQLMGAMCQPQQGGNINTRRVAGIICWPLGHPVADCHGDIADAQGFRIPDI